MSKVFRDPARSRRPAPAWQVVQRFKRRVQCGSRLRSGVGSHGAQRPNPAWRTVRKRGAARDALHSRAESGATLDAPLEMRALVSEARNWSFGLPRRADPNHIGPIGSMPAPGTAPSSANCSRRDAERHATTGPPTSSPPSPPPQTPQSSRPVPPVPPRSAPHQRSTNQSPTALPADPSPRRRSAQNSRPCPRAEACG